MTDATAISPILITGVSQRVGLHCALALRQAGFDVVGTYRDENKSAENLSTLQQAGVQLIQADFSDEQGITEFIEQIQARYGSLRAIIHNASAWQPDQAQADHHTQHALATRMFTIHALAPYRMNLALAPLLQAGETATDIIHITDYVVRSGSDHHIAYAASKAALDSMTQSFARRFAPKIKVNSIAPSLVMFNSHDDQAYREKALSKSLLGIEPGAQVVMQTIEYLLNNPYVTGQQLVLDGGRSIRQS